MLYVGYLIILDGQNIKKIQFQKFPLESCISWLCPSPLGTPPPQHPLHLPIAKAALVDIWPHGPGEAP